jgi:DNA (cytosine-5)-methyltransferase 1
VNVAVRPEPRPGDLNLLSICTGGGGLDLAAELAIERARVVCMVEREAFAVERLASAMGQGLLAPAPVWSDVRTFRGRPWRGLLDGVFGGIPCQPHSLAGKRLGEDDERDLWAATRRIFVQSGAWFLWIENVGGMLSSGGAERVWRDVQRLGCAVEGGLFTAAETGWPQERERLFLLAVSDRARSSQRLRRAGDAEQELATAERIRGVDMADAEVVGRGEGRAGSGLRGRAGQEPADGRGDLGDALGRQRDGRSDEPQRGAGGRTAAGGAGEAPLIPPRPDDGAGWALVRERWPQLEPAVRRMADGVAPRVDRLRLLGNGVHPLEGAYALRTLAARLAARGSPGAAELVRMMGVEG